MFGFNKKSLREKRLTKRKKILEGLLARLLNREAILEVELEQTKEEILKTKKGIRETIKRKESGDEKQ